MPWLQSGKCVELPQQGRYMPWLVFSTSACCSGVSFTKPCILKWSIGEPLESDQPPVEANFPAPPYCGFCISPFSKISFLLARPNAQRRFSTKPAFDCVIFILPLPLPSTNFLSSELNPPRLA